MELDFCPQNFEKLFKCQILWTFFRCERTDGQRGIYMTALFYVLLTVHVAHLCSQISKQSAHEVGKVVSPTHRPPLLSRKYTWYSFLLEAVSTPGPQYGRKVLYQWKIEPATFRLVAQCLNQLRKIIKRLKRSLFKETEDIQISRQSAHATLHAGRLYPPGNISGTRFC